MCVYVYVYTCIYIYVCVRVCCASKVFSILDVLRWDPPLLIYLKKHGTAHYDPTVLSLEATI